MTTYFVQTRHFYEPYKDLFDLARLSDYPVIYIDEVEALDAVGNAFIVSPANGEWTHWRKGQFQARVIMLQLEYNIDGQNNPPAAVTEIWHGDKWHAETYGYRYVPLGSHEGLNIADNPTLDKRYDVAMLSYMSNRRQVMLQMLDKEQVTQAPTLWGVERSNALTQARAMLHVHQWGKLPEDVLQAHGIGLDYNVGHVDMPCVAPLRWCIAAAHKLPMITEQVMDRGVFTPDVLLQAEFRYLAGFVRYLIDSDYPLQEFGDALHERLCCDYTFRRSIEGAL